MSFALNKKRITQKTRTKECKPRACRAYQTDEERRLAKKEKNKRYYEKNRAEHVRKAHFYNSRRRLVKELSKIPKITSPGRCKQTV